MDMTCYTFVQWETHGVGVQWDNIGNNLAGYRFDLGLVMMFVSMIFFLLLGFYLDSVLPKSYGERLSPIFCITCCCKKSVGPNNEHSSESNYKSELH